MFKGKSFSEILQAPAAQLQPPAPMRAPDPLVVESRNRNEFPVECLSPTLRAGATAINEMRECGLAIAGQAVLAAASLAVQGLFDIELPYEEPEIKPVSLYQMTVAGSSSGKSPAFSKALEAVEATKKKLWTAYLPLKETYIQEKVVYDAQLARIAKSNLTKAERDKELDELGSEPKLPIDPVLTLEDTTIEGIVNAYVKGRPSLGLFLDEGGIFTEGHSMNKDNKNKTAAILSSFHSGTSYTHTRVGTGGTVFLPNRRLTVFFQIQPGLAAKLFTPSLIDQGLLNRFLVTSSVEFVEKTGGKKLIDTNDRFNQYRDRLTSFLDFPLPTLETDKQQLELTLIRFNKDARELWMQYMGQVQDQMRPDSDGDYREIAGFAGKMWEQCARIAAVNSAFESGPKDIDEETIERATTLTNYFAGQLLSMHESRDDEVDIANANLLWKWLQDAYKKLFITDREFCSSAPHRFRGREGETLRRNAINVLERKGYLGRAQTGTLVEGRVTRSEVWQVNLYR